MSLVVPYAAGGPTDAMARTLATSIKPILGQTMIVENKAGAGANIGAESVARAAPDGYTLMFGTSAPLGINLYLYPKINYDPFKSFTPVTQIGYLPNVLVTYAPTIWAPRSSPVLASNTVFTMPSGSPRAMALPLPMKGKRPTLT